jgi:hypothetical protein
VADHDDLVVGGHRITQREVVCVDRRGVDPAIGDQPRPRGGDPRGMQRCADPREDDRPPAVQPWDLAGEQLRDRVRLCRDLII